MRGQSCVSRLPPQYFSTKFTNNKYYDNSPLGFERLRESFIVPKNLTEYWYK